MQNQREKKNKQATENTKQLPGKICDQNTQKLHRHTHKGYQFHLMLMHWQKEHHKPPTSHQSTHEMELQTVKHIIQK